MKKFINRFFLIFGLIGLSISSAFAAVPAAASAAFTELETDVLAMVDLAWPVMVAITVAFILLRVFRRAASSAV